MAASVVAGNDPFSGGGRFPAAVPTAGPTGSISGANVGATLLAGVAGSDARMARNTRGSNISIPYARVVQHPAGRTALPNKPKARTNLQTNDQVRLLGKPGGDMMVETAMLHTGRLCFVLGRRGHHSTMSNTSAGPAGLNELLGMEYQKSTGDLINARTQSRLQSFATGGVDMFTMQRMCSFEYLERYFFFVLREKTIDLSEAVDIGTGATPQIKWLGATPGTGGQLGNLNDVNGAAILRELAKRAGITIDAGTIEVGGFKIADATFKSGIFASDDGPFLRGRMIDSTLVKANVGNDAKMPANIGDIIAFQGLEKMLKDSGVMDWMPDGVVLSKLSSGGVGGSTQMQDDEIDSRDGQLFNVTVSGPAVTSTWTHDPQMEVLPLDKVFVVILGDVFTGDVPADAKTALNEGKMEEYETEFQKAIGVVDDATAKKARADRLGAPEKQIITNLQVRKMTSSQMINGSAYTNTERSRLGLPIGGNGGRYIVGGWCIGTVIDSSAARATHDGVALMGGVKRAKCTHAANIVVNVEWWSADRMFQMYMNRGAEQGNRGVLRSRYDMSKLVLTKGGRPAVVSAVAAAAAAAAP